MRDIVLRPCPECGGSGELYPEDAPAVTCGVCLGDAFIWPVTPHKPSWLDGRFEDHSGLGHACAFCQPLTSRAAQWARRTVDQVIEHLDQPHWLVGYLGEEVANRIADQFGLGGASISEQGMAARFEGLRDQLPEFKGVPS